MADLILGVVVDVIGHVVIEILELFGVGLVAASARDFVVLDSAELIVLLPEIGLENFGGREKTQDRDIAISPPPVGAGVVVMTLRFREQCRARS